MTRTLARRAFWALILVAVVYAIGAVELDRPGSHLAAIAVASILTLIAIALHRKGQPR